MSRQLLVLLSACAFAACSGEPPTQGAVRVAVSWEGFSPGCLELTAHDAAQGTSTKSQTTLAVETPERMGERVFAVFQKEGWGSSIALTARAFEGSCSGGIVVARSETTVSVGGEEVADGTLLLTASDADGDGFVDNQGEFPGSDCDDASAAVHPAATEVCNGIDDNCNGQVDEGGEPTLWYQDADGDGVGKTGTEQLACSPPAGFVARTGDCNDEDPSVHPDAPETCNGIDDDCDGMVDEDGPTTFYRDADGDTYGTPNDTEQACAPSPGYVVNASDCNDSDPNVNPGATETCNGIDDDCNGSTDEGVTLTFYADADGDSYGSPSVTQQACAPSSGWVVDATDCNDSDPNVNPGADEICNLIDDDCDGSIDEGVKLTFFQDADGDTYGNLVMTEQACTPSAGYVANALDCNDSDAMVNPGATEICNGVDDDCDGETDVGIGSTWYEDLDGDGDGVSTSTTLACTQPVGFAATDTDCDDGNPFRYAGATERCDGMDNDCDGTADDGLTCTSAWTAVSGSGGGGHAWRSIHVYAPGKAWVAGRDNKLRHFDGMSSTTNYDGQCSGMWEAAWSSGAGVVYLGAQNGSFAWHDGGQACQPSPTLTSGSNDVRGLVGVSTSNGPTVFAAGTDGRVIRWQTWMGGASGVSELTRVTGVSLWDIDAVSVPRLFAVGGSGPAPHVPEVVRRVGSSFVQDPLPAGLTGALRRVDAVNDNLAWAVGDGGLLFMFNGTTWTQLPPPPDATGLHGVRAFGSTLVYVAGTTPTDNRVWRGDVNGWTVVRNIPSAKVPTDLGGTAPWDLWVVGDGGLVERFSDAP